MLLFQNISAVILIKYQKVQTINSTKKLVKEIEYINQTPDTPNPCQIPTHHISPATTYGWLLFLGFILVYVLLNIYLLFVIVD